jgi:hypothetical protein
MRLQYLGPDEDPYLKHGQHYEVEDHVMKSGRHRLNFVDIPFKKTVDEYEFSRLFAKPAKKPKFKGTKGKEKR